jgi:PD-(D/E)XK nuclease family transposase
MKAKYIDPFTDFGFKKIFGEEASKPVLQDFLNSLLPPENRIKRGNEGEARGGTRGEN